MFSEVYARIIRLQWEKMVAVMGLFHQLGTNVYCGKIDTGKLCPGSWTPA